MEVIQVNDSKEKELKKSVKGGKYENLILEEDRKKGQVELSVYKEYFRMSTVKIPEELKSSIRRSF